MFIVADIGKTLSKLTLWSDEGKLLDRQVRQNEPLQQDGIQRLDAGRIGLWMIQSLARYRGHEIRAIIPVGHGAGIAAIEAQGLIAPPFDYEQPLPDDLLAAYRRLRSPFAETGSPPLPGGLNMAAQICWMDRLLPERMARAQLMPWAQYWAWFLCGVASTEVTSLGCHSDLWNPSQGCFSAMAVASGMAARFAPMARAGDMVGRLRPEIAAQTGLSPDIPVLAGLHDSNAALLAARGFSEIGGLEATILSTGTWFVAMRTPAPGCTMPVLPEGRDCLVNVDVEGRPVPSARFMGGREIENVIQIDTRRVDIRPDQPALLAALPQVVAQEAMLFPTLAPGCGPFPEAVAGWRMRPEDWYARRAAVCLYAALVAETALGLIGTSGQLLVEGRFAEADVFVRALASLRPDLRVHVANAHNDVSFGALRLIDPSLRPAGALRRVEPLETDIGAYAAKWRAFTTRNGNMDMGEVEWAATR